MYSTATIDFGLNSFPRRGCHGHGHGHGRMVIDFTTTYNQYLSLLNLLVRIPLRQGVLNTTLCDQVCHGLRHNVIKIKWH